MTEQLVDGQADGVDDDPTATDATPAPDATTAATGSSAFGRWRERRRHRISKWDRPPEPKDWRYFVSTLGKVLIATGVLMFGFVAYQLWGTGIETARAQSKLKGEFQEQVEAISGGAEPSIGVQNWVKPIREDTVDAPAVDPSDGTSDDQSDDDIGLTDVGEDPLDSVPTFPLSDAVPGGVDLSDYAVEQNVPILPGDSFALIEIPKIGVSKYVVPGVQPADLKRGVGHYPDTPLPGQLGNASIAGHRTTYGAPFFDLDQLVPGDEIDVTMVTGDRFVYRVTGIEVVTAADYWVVTTRDPNVAELTLTTCHPKYTARDRLVVHSVLVPEESSQVGVAEFYELDEEGDTAPIPGDDPTLAAEPAATQPVDTPADTAVDLTADSEVADPPSDDATTAGTETGDIETGDAVPSEDAADDAAADPDTVDDVAGDTTSDESTADPTTDVLAAEQIDPDDAELDAFSQGWFDDRDAFPQIALWGVALTIISLLAYQVSKRTRHDSIGFLVGIAPFLVCLYFFFQNVNRLLPPGL